MSTLDQEQEVVDLAGELGLTGSPVAAIINFCQAQIDAWVHQAGGVNSVDALEAVVAQRLNLVFEEVQCGSDLADLKRRYVQMGEPVFAHIVENDLTSDTFGTMVKLKDGTHVAVIDCRGVKAARRFFTRWHEIAHLLVEPDCEKQVFRSSDEPMERLMDQIAGHVGFYDSIFSPLFGQHISAGERLTFDIVESIRQEFCPHASFQSTLYACHRRLNSPLLCVEAKLAFTASERREINQGRLFNDDKPEMKLRVKHAIPNEPAINMELAARKNMRVPESSVIHRAFRNELSGAEGEENLKTWTFSKGGSLIDCEVFIQARYVDGTVMATIQPVECE